MGCWDRRSREWLAVEQGEHRQVGKHYECGRGRSLLSAAPVFVVDAHFVIIQLLCYG